MPSQGFPPIAEASAHTLILGSLPGKVSLARGQYYAQPRNAFWRLMGDLFGVPPELPYEQRARALARHGIALWDVCASAHRPGSLDADIALTSVITNDIERFLASHRSIDRIVFNGAKAAELYRRLVLPTLRGTGRPLETLVLPSTSPAHAAMPYADKLRHWSALRNPPRCVSP